MNLQGRIGISLGGIVVLTGLLAAANWTQFENAPSVWFPAALIGASAGSMALIAFLGWTLANLAVHLKDLTMEMASGASEVAIAAEHVSRASQALAKGSSDQAASLEQTSATSEQITSMTRRNASSAQTAAELMVEVDKSVSSANKAIGEMVYSMQGITSSSGKIARIIKVIDEIAFQTNILALNAAVEAARAGEAGMGFAVVADEVRNLAQRSAQAAKDTAALIDESIQKSGAGGVRLEEVTAAIKSITSSTAKAKLLIDDVNTGSRDEAKSIEQISSAIAQMEAVTQSNAASAEEGASASQELSAQADSMSHSIANLRTLLSGLGGQQVRYLNSSPTSVSPRTLPSQNTLQRRKAEGNSSGTSLADPFPMSDDDFAEF